MTTPEADLEIPIEDDEALRSASVSRKEWLDEAEALHDSLELLELPEE